MKIININLGSRSYQILVGAGLLAQAGARLRAAGLSDKAVIVTDPTVARLCGDTMKESLQSSGFQVGTALVPEGEEQKSLEAAGKLYQQLTDFPCERLTPVLALGGGVIGDLTGFVAATYQRGVPLIQVPTTLLAQVDSSIGGKVAVNYGHIKNKIGAFYQPRLVIADISLLRTLPAGDISDGMAEVIKYGIIRDAGFFTFIEKDLARIISLDGEAIEHVVATAAVIKGSVVEQDELDLGVRNILNYGHTIGHAIEAVSDFRVRHGAAVAIGMVAAARIALRLGCLAESELARITSLIYRAGLPVKLPELAPERLLEAMKFDKKLAQGKIRFVLPRRIGEVFITDEVTAPLVKEVLDEL